MLRQGLTILLLSLSCTLVSQIPSGGLIGEWLFSGNANDASISANHGTLVAATPTLDRCGTPNSAYYFNGSSDYIRMSLSGPTGTLSRSVSFWAKTTNTVSNSPRSSFHYGTSGTTSDSYQVVWNYCSQGIGLDLGNQALIRGNICLENNAWHHIVAVFDATASTSYSNVAFYVDGILQSVLVCNVSGSNASINTGPNVPIVIGKDANFNSRYWQGSLDDFFLYNRALSASEVLQLYNLVPCMYPVSGPTLVCIGSTNTYSVPPITNGTYTWTLPSGWTGTSTTNTISAVAMNSGIITVAVSSTCGIQPGYSVAVTVFPGNSIMITSSSPTICSYESATLTASGASTYTWSNSSTNNSISISPNATTIYSATSQNAAGCIGTASYTQYVTPAPIITTSPSIIPCNNVATTIQAQGANAYTWTPMSSTNSFVVISPTTSINYTVVGSIAGCTSAVVASLMVPPGLSLSIASTSNAICFGNSVTFTSNASGGTGPYSYSWSPSSNTNSVESLSATTVGIYSTTAIVTDANACQIAVTETVNFFPGVTLSIPSVSACPNASNSLSVFGASTYTWLPGPIMGSNYPILVPSNTIYTVTGTSSSGCVGTETASLFIYPAPILSFSTFSITCGSLGSATLQATGPGPYNFSWTPTAQTGSVANNLFPGNYTVTTTDLNTSCVFNSTTTFLPLVPMTGTVSNSASNPCNGIGTGTASISLSAGSGTQTYLWTSANGVQTSSAATNLAAGINTVSVTDALTFCNVTHTFFISQPPALTLAITASSASVCLGGSINLGNTISGGTPGYTFNWWNTQTSPTLNIQELTAGIYNYTLNAVDANSCAVNQTINLNFVPNPTVTVNSLTICPLQQSVLTASGASTYSWSSGPLTSIFISFPTSGQTHTVYGTALGCTSSATATIFVKPVPIPSITANSPLCQNDQLNVFVSGGSAYQWSGPLSFTTSTSTFTFNNAQPIQSGAYNVTVTALNSCTASVSQSIIINPNPILAASASTVCVNGTLTLTCNYVSGATYLWTGSSLTQTNQNVFVSAAQPAMSGPYTVFVTSTAGCTAQTVVQASVSPAINPIITGSNAACEGTSFTLQANGGGQYIWYGPSGILSFSNTLSLPNIVTNQAGNYSVVVTNGPCQNTTGITLTVYPKPILTGSITTPVCEGGTALFTASGAPNISWQPSGGGSIPGSNVSLFPVKPINAGTYSLVGIDNNGCTNFTPLQLQVLAMPIPIVQNYTACLGGPLTMTAGGGQTYTWTGPSNFSAQSATASIPLINAAQSGTYFVSITGTNNCVGSASVLVVAQTLPLPELNIAGNPNFCRNSTSILIALGKDQHFWLGPNNFKYSGDTIILNGNNPAAVGIYTLIANAANFCAASVTIATKLYELPKAKLNALVLHHCVPFCQSFELIPEKNTGNLAETIVLVNEQKTNLTANKYCFTSGGKYQFKFLIKDSFNCVNSFVKDLEVYEKPSADFTYTPSNPIAGQEPVNFYSTSTGNFLSNWAWYLLPGDSVTGSAQNQIHFYEQEGQYPVALVVKNKWGCADTALKLININDQFTLYVPNSFTPNNDQLNDVFLAKGSGILSFEMIVYNRWGEIIFSSTAIDKGWDGKFHDKDCPNDTYIWKINAKQFNGKDRSLNGRITLLR